MSRRLCFLLHSWTGIVTGLCLLAITWTGSVVVFNDEIEWLASSYVRADPRQGARPLDEPIAAIQRRYPGERFAFHVQTGVHWSHTAFVYTKPATRFLRIDPATAEITRDDAMEGYFWDLGYFLRQLHVRLLMGFWGRVFVGLFGVTLLLSILTSLWIYREWLRSLVRIRRGDGRRIFHMDLHKAVGLWALVFNVIFGVTGAVLGLENLYYRLWPRSTSDAAMNPVDRETRVPPHLSIGQAVQSLAALEMSFVPAVIEVAPSGGPLIVRGDHPGALIAKGSSAYAVELDTGRVVGGVDARRARWPTFLYNTLDPLHFGYFGDEWGLVSGYAIRAIWFLAGLTPGVLGITGGMMWLLRRERSRAARAARAALDVLPATATRGHVRGAALAAYLSGLTAFLLIGYSLQATVWNRGWWLNETIWQHWIVKPFCLVAVCFPLSAGALALGWIAVKAADARNTRALALGLLGAVPLGAIYLAATSVFN